jgi:hypothetical protein
MVADAVGTQASAEAARGSNSAAVVFAQGKSSANRNTQLAGTDGMVSVAPNENMTGRDFSGFASAEPACYHVCLVLFISETI